jgi:hypothetical protein
LRVNKEICFKHCHSVRDQMGWPEPENGPQGGRVIFCLYSKQGYDPEFHGAQAPQGPYPTPVFGLKDVPEDCPFILEHTVDESNQTKLD